MNAPPCDRSWCEDYCKDYMHCFGSASQWTPTCKDECAGCHDGAGTLPLSPSASPPAGPRYHDCLIHPNDDDSATDLPGGACCTSGRQCASDRCDYTVNKCAPLSQPASDTSSLTGSTAATRPTSGDMNAPPCDRSWCEDYCKDYMHCFGSASQWTPTCNEMPLRCKDE